MLFANLVIVFFAALTHAQAAAKCFTLTNTQMCGPYSEMQIQPLDGVFSDVPSFDAFMLTVTDTNSSYIADFKTRYACPSFTGLGQRFHMSTYCGLFVNAASSNGCNANAEAVQICPSSIAAAITSLQAIYNSSTCTQMPNEARTSFLLGYSTYQSRLSNTSTTCLSGFQSEIEQCGFFTVAEAMAYCSTNSSDPCCGSTQLLNATLPLMIANHQNLIASAQPAVASPNGVVIGASIAGVVVFLLIIFAAVYLYKRRGNSPQQKSTYSTDSPAQIAETYEVIYNYVPNLSDEVYLYVGDKIIVKCKFDDGWALGYNMSTKQEGSFPMACVDEFAQGGDFRSTYKSESNIKQRGSSLYIPKN